MTFRPIQLAVSVVALAVLFSNLLYGQQDLTKKQLEHADYDAWSTMIRSTISRDGKWALFTVQNGAIDGEATVTFRSLDSEKQYVVERGSAPRFTWDSKFALYQITPSKAKLKQLKKAKGKGKDKNKADSKKLPTPVFQILELETGELTTIENVKSFRTPEKSGDWVACLLEETAATDQLKTTKPAVNETYEVTEAGLERPAKPIKLKKRPTVEKSPAEEKPEEKTETEEGSKEPDTKKEKQKTEKSDSKNKDSEKKEKESGKPLLLVNLATGVQRTFPDVTSFVFSEHGHAIAFATSVDAEKVEKVEKEETKEEETKEEVEKEKVEKEEETKPSAVEPTAGVYVIDLETLEKTKVASGLGNYKGLAINEAGTQLAFVTDRDDYDAKTSSLSLYHWSTETEQAKKIATEGDEGIPKGWWVAPNSAQLFSEDGKRLYFETAPVPKTVLKQRSGDEEEDDDEDVVKLDVWHWQDPQLQPQQLLEADRERKRDYRAVYVLETEKLVQLATLEIPNIAIDVRSKSKLAVANTNYPYRKMMSWEVPGFRDVWLVNLDTGKQEQVLKRVEVFADMSPEGEFITWFDGEKESWFAKSTSDADSEAINISEGIKFPLYDELHDRPFTASAYGSAGWLADDKAFLVYDRYDIWQLDPTGKKDPVCVTDGYGRENEIQFRYRRLDPEMRSIDPEQPMMLSAMNKQSKASGYWRLNLESEDQDTPQLTKLIMLPESVGRIDKAQESDRVIFTRSTFQMCPDLWHSDMDFKKIHRLSDMNPQQEDFAWGTTELVQWKSKDDQELDGLLYKPDGFDPSKKYPLMVYFYERNSDNLHRYYAPAAGRSIINFSFYVSRGYVVFVPDIPYTTGEPGQSAANAILPGVESLVAQGFVDEEKIGMQGHSWGGYQTAYLVTQTDMFACAESGAPVSNMTSAYGGIRWGSGMSRMFQYERTQSRIGEDLWAARDKYIQNSPVFYADKINTPLLILHNDKDGAVPWYQGIELFVALRRLEKPAWMLNYNGNPHWVMGEKNRRDFAIRMQQFFDHYLMDAPEPEWMALGVPAVNKGEELGLELLEPLKTETEKASEEVNEEAGKESSDESND